MRRTEYNDGWIACGDCLDLMAQMEEQSVDLVFGSPPYEKARLYLEDGVDLGIARNTEEWVAWMVEVFRASLRVSRGLVAMVVGHGQSARDWTAGPALLMADLKRSGVTLRNPPIYHRNGIMGSGTTDWLRADYEWIVCATNGPGELPWSDNTAYGHSPKWQPGGTPSHRTVDGSRVRQGGRSTMRGTGNGEADGNRKEQYYVPPDKANPGNVIHCQVGGGNIGSNIAHENEAPFPLQLAEFFVRSFCPPGGTVCDPFSGSGTTAHAAIRWGRKFAAMDLRPSQIELIKRRVRQARLEGKQLI